MEIDEELSPVWWFLAFFHEAGHAVAAARCARPVREIYVHPKNGFTQHGLLGLEDDEEHMKFLISAGPWAESRALWMINGFERNGYDASGRTFADIWRDLFRKNLIDWRDYHLQGLGYQVSQDDLAQVNNAYFFPGGASLPAYENLPGGGWDALPDDFWTEVRRLAMVMMEAAPEVDVGHGQPVLEQVATTHWRRRPDS